MCDDVTDVENNCVLVKRNIDVEFISKLLRVFHECWITLSLVFQVPQLESRNIKCLSYRISVRIKLVISTSYGILFSIIFHLFFWDVVSCSPGGYVDKNGLVLLSLLTLAPKCWDESHVLSWQGHSVLWMEFRASCILSIYFTNWSVVRQLFSQSFALVILMSTSGECPQIWFHVISYLS